MVDWSRLLSMIEEVQEASLSFEGADKDILVFDSTALSRIAFDADPINPSVGTLTLQFKESGSVYEYYSFPARKARYLMQEAPSKGRYMVKKIRMEYPYSRIL